MKFTISGENCFLEVTKKGPPHLSTEQIDTDSHFISPLPLEILLEGLLLLEVVTLIRCEPCIAVDFEEITLVVYHRRALCCGAVILHQSCCESACSLRTFRHFCSTGTLSSENTESSDTSYRCEAKTKQYMHAWHPINPPTGTVFCFLPW